MILEVGVKRYQVTRKVYGAIVLVITAFFVRY